MATRYILIGDLLYKKSYSKLHSDPYLRCLGSDEARWVMKEIHASDRENHVEGRSFSHKVINQGYYWPKMFYDSKEYVKKCQQCQRFTLSNRPSEDLHNLQSPWSLYSGGSSGRPSSLSSTSTQVSIGSYGLLYQVDRSRITLRCHRTIDSQIPTKYHMSF